MALDKRRENTLVLQQCRLISLNKSLKTIYVHEKMFQLNNVEILKKIFILVCFKLETVNIAYKVGHVKLFREY